MGVNTTGARTACPRDGALATKHAGESSALRSCLYECEVMHRRLAPKEHRFDYRIFMFYLELDELDAVAERTTLFSRNRWNVYAYRDADHLSFPDGSRREEAYSNSEFSQSLLMSAAATGTTKASILAYLTQRGVAFPAGGRIMLLTMPRVFGYIFNPVSFYFCFDAAGAPLCALAEVGNTFRELKPFLLGPDTRTAPDTFRLRVPKHFYVSPFSGLEVEFDFRLRAPGEQLEIHINDFEAGRPTLVSALTGRRAPLTGGRLAWFTFKYPLLTLRVIALIHWHALRLWCKRVPFHRKAANAELQREVFNPHTSLIGKCK